MSGLLPFLCMTLAQLPPIRTVDASSPGDPALAAGTDMPFRALEFLNSYAPVFLVAFVVTLLATPIVRRVAVWLEIIDKPDQTRKLHKFPIAYLGGFAVFAGLITAIMYSLFLMKGPAGHYAPVPMAVVLGILVITFTGLADDTWGWDPRLKIAGQLVAAAALAMENVGVRVAEGALVHFLGPSDALLLSVAGMEIHNAQLYYWVGTAIIAIFVLGGCNATNLIDGLDGLLSGVIAIMMIGFLAVSLLMATLNTAADPTTSLAGARIVICLATLGAVLGFLPWNFNPAVIFLGDCGSLLLGYLSVVVILMFGAEGETHLVIAGLIIFALPIMDTLLAIVRRKLAGVPFSTADSNHIHHQLRRALGGVKKAVFALYGITLAFSILGTALAALVLTHGIRLQVVYSLAMVLFAFIAAIAIKAARRQQWEGMMATAAAQKQSVPASPPAPAAAAGPLDPATPR
ncbi:MAG: MraY family glycosyltransferase [Phycisphaerae bacterium]|nr:MraY family glycosyltransferase [Phycisphaerae bacterium]